MRWVLVRPRSRSGYYDPEIQEPLGIEMLSAGRRAVGDHVLVLDGVLSQASDEALARRAAAFEPDAVGFSMTTAQEVPHVTALRESICEALVGRRVRWLAGGNFISSETERAAELLPPDATLVRFEGETAMEALATIWAGGHSAPRVIDGAAADIGTMPFADRPFARAILDAGWAFNLQGSRGCRGACTYCASAGLRPPGGRRWRGRPPWHVVGEIAFLHARYGARAFNFVDEDFLGPNQGALDRAAQLAHEIGRRGLRVSIGIQARPDSLTPEIARLLVRAGLTYVFLGLESDDEDDLRRWGRPPLGNAFALIEELRALGVEVHAGTLLFHSGSTLRSVERFARSLVDHDLLDFLAANNRLDAMPGSALYGSALAHGSIDPAVAGPQALPFEDPAVETFHREVRASLAPLGPPWMHAMCALPPLLARAGVEHEAPRALAPLRRLLAGLRRDVAHTFFALLERHAARAEVGPTVESLRGRNLDRGCTAVHELVGLGLAPSFEPLREAIVKDAGL